MLNFDYILSLSLEERPVLCLCTGVHLRHTIEQVKVVIN